jgi:hypothetical protein
MGEFDLIQDKIKRHYFLIRSDVDRVKAWEEAERRKIHAFGRLKFFHRPDPDEITCSEFKTYYEPYVMIHMSKESHKRPYPDGKDRPNSDVSSDIDNSHDIDVILIFDQTGKKVDDQSPFTSLTALSKTFYEEHREEFLRSDICVRKAIETFKVEEGASTTVNSRIHHIGIVYVPIFYAKYCWKKTGEHRIIKVDGRNCRSEVYTP